MNKALITLFIFLHISVCFAYDPIHYVPGYYPTIQEAIDYAFDGDIIIVSPGIYRENIDFKGKEICVTSVAPDDWQVVESTVIEADQDGSVVSFISGETPNTKLTGFTIRGGNGTLWVDNEDGQIYCGGGIICLESSPVISRNIIESNIIPYNSTDLFGYGAGIFCLDGQALIDRNIFRFNDTYAGGGIVVFGENSKISSNLFHNNYGLIGGASVLISNKSFVNNTLTQNEAEYAGNLYVEGDGVVVNNIIVNAIRGGGLYWANKQSQSRCAFNNIWGNTDGDYFNMGSLNGIDGNISVNPEFVDSAASDYSILETSGCFNAGDPDWFHESEAMDLEENPRVYAGCVDIGAYEYIGYYTPIAKAGPDQQVPDIQQVMLDGSNSLFYDPSGVKEFQWSQTVGEIVVLSDTQSMTPIFNPVSLGEYRFELVVNDGLNSSQPDEVMIYVGNRIPVADAGSDKAYNINSVVTLDGGHSYDYDPGSILTYRWRQLSGPTVTLFEETTATPEFAGITIGVYEFELVVNDGIVDSQPDTVTVVISEISYQQEPYPADLDNGNNIHYPDISDTWIVYSVGSACDFTWDIFCRRPADEFVRAFSSGGLEIQPKASGNVVTWFGGSHFGSPWKHEPLNTSVFVADILANRKKTLRAYTNSQSYSYPVVSNNKVLWIEHLGLDTHPIGSSSANNWYNTPFSVCGADISDWENVTYFTVAADCGNRDPYNWAEYTTDFEDPMDIDGDIVVWEADGDIYGANISDITNIEVFVVCDAPGRQYDPAISDNIVVWTDTRNDNGDIYAADITDLSNINYFEVHAKSGIQNQPDIESGLVAFIEGQQIGQLKVCGIIRNIGAIEIPVDVPLYAGGPSINRNHIVYNWNENGSMWEGRARGITVNWGYQSSDGPVHNISQSRRYDYINHAVTTSLDNEIIELEPGIYSENIYINGKNIVLRSIDPNDESVVSSTILKGIGLGPVIEFDGTEDEFCFMKGLTITGGKNSDNGGGIAGNGTGATIEKCVIKHNEAQNGGGIAGFDGGEIKNCLIVKNKAQMGAGGIYDCKDTRIMNCTIADNEAGGLLKCNQGSRIENCIIWSNQTAQLSDCDMPNFSNIQYWPDGTLGCGNINVDPLFADPSIDDYHLKTEGWRWEILSGQWVWDSVTSLCIDSGNPSVNFCTEPVTLDVDPLNRWGRNLRINMGAYGGTETASMPPYNWALMPDVTNDGRVNYYDYKELADEWLSNNINGFSDFSWDNIISLTDLAMLSNQWLEETTWCGNIPVPEDDTLLGHWTFDEAAGSVIYDDSLNAIHGEVVGAQWTEGMKGAGLLFDGIDDYINLDNDIRLKTELPITITAWINVAEDGSGGRIVSIDEHETCYQGIWCQVKIIDGEQRFAVAYGDGRGGKNANYRRTKATNWLVLPFEWMHVAFVIKNAEEMHIYINGIEFDGVYSGSGQGLAYSDGESHIGDNGGGGRAFKGKIDDVRIYHRALSDVEIQVLGSN